MKDLSLLVWLSQLGLSVALPLGGCTLVALWLRNQFHWGNWILVVGIILGLVCAFDGLRTSLKAMKRLSDGKSDKDPPVSYNEHE